MATKKLRILLAEDHATVREGLRLILNAQPDMEVVAEAEDGHAAVAQASKLRPDVLVMDVSMPVLNGLKATELLQQTCPDVKIVMLTRHGASGYLQQLLRAGASGYVLKQSRSVDLLQGIRAAASGGTYIDPSLAGDLFAERGHQHTRTAPGDAAATLSPREAEVLRLVAAGHSNKDAARELGISVKTVETHKANGMQKLGMRTRIDVVRFALLQGWLDQT
jgi:DNA-binding NarL/FixJ family response regulator